MPKYVLPLPEKEPFAKKKIPQVEYLDRLIMRVNILKCGKVRVKLLPQMLTLTEKYFSKNKVPPAKTLATELKTLGYDEEFTRNLPKKIEKRKVEMESRYKKLELVFNKPTTTSKKKKKEPEPETEQEEEIEEEEEENEDDDVAPEEEAIGADDEDDDEAVVEEEYISDVE
jgi:thymidylate synthase